jgi:serine protease Do
VSVKLTELTEQVADAQDAPVPPANVPESTSSLGMTLVPNGDGTGGLLIQEVEEDTAAAQRGLSVGDVVLEVDNKPITSIGDFETAISGVKDRGLETALVKVARGGEARFIGLPLSE